MQRKRHGFTKQQGQFFVVPVVTLVVGLANDSSVCVAPLFWILMGLGFAVNHMIKRSKAKEEEQ